MLDDEYWDLWDGLWSLLFFNSHFTQWHRHNPICISLLHSQILPFPELQIHQITILAQTASAQNPSAATWRALQIQCHSNPINFTFTFTRASCIKLHPFNVPVVEYVIISFVVFLQHLLRPHLRSVLLYLLELPNSANLFRFPCWDMFPTFISVFFNFLWELYLLLLFCFPLQLSYQLLILGN